MNQFLTLYLCFIISMKKKQIFNNIFRISPGLKKPYLNLKAKILPLKNDCPHTDLGIICVNIAISFMVFIPLYVYPRTAGGCSSVVDCDNEANNFAAALIFGMQFSTKSLLGWPLSPSVHLLINTLSRSPNYLVYVCL